jgi:hypothetical protein
VALSGGQWPFTPGIGRSPPAVAEEVRKSGRRPETRPAGLRAPPPQARGITRHRRWHAP